MFSKSIVAFFSVAAAIISGVSAGPIARRSTDSNLVVRTDQSPNNVFSLNGWGGRRSMDNFDDFFGSDNFDGSRNEQVIINQQQVVCRQEKIVIIQQRLAVIRELMKRVIIEQICEVETQVIVLQQHESSFNDFYSDLFRQSGRNVGFDSSVSSHIGSFFNEDGSLTSDDFGFNGRDIGKNTVSYGGFNWDSSSSPSSVRDARNAALSASSSTSINPAFD